MKLGIIVGRFQSPFLHEGYRFLIDRVLAHCDKLAIVISTSPLPSSIRNPFTLAERQAIITANLKDLNKLSKFAGFIITKDNPSDEKWSTDLDFQVSKFCLGLNSQPTTITKTLFGSRDSFIPHYSGTIPVMEVKSMNDDISSSDIRSNLADHVPEEFFSDLKYLTGKIAALAEQYPKVYPTVDIAIVDKPNNRVLLGRKPYEKLWRFPGGFTDTTDACFEDAAFREAYEECGNDLQLNNMKYICSHRINDWRYRRERDKIITTFFMVDYLSGEPKASDDLEDVDWFDIDELIYNMELIMAGHRPLFMKLVEYLKGK